ncbi:hypothetical protein K502DRAFT_324677 [Neoconidiobolus thromboides FSU 785]|nr:hypothetical protein K502DRAFT_324677 [Neoconidiobolus thromboides FSU 785]
MTKASSKLKETLVRDTKKVKVKKEIKDAAENLIQDQAEVKETLARDTKKVKVKKEIKDAAEKLIQDQAEVKEIQVVKKRIVKAKPVPASYLPETDLEHLKLMETLPKKPSKDFVFEYLTKVDK